MRIGNEKGVPISPELIGLFFEDINFAADGGLYAEMIENRSFEAREAYGNPGRFYAVDDPGYAWKSVQQIRGRGSVYAVCDRYSGVQRRIRIICVLLQKRQDRVLQTRHTMGSVWKKIIPIVCPFMHGVWRMKAILFR